MNIKRGVLGFGYVHRVDVRANAIQRAAMQVDRRAARSRAKTEKAVGGGGDGGIAGRRQ